MAVASVDLDIEKITNNCEVFAKFASEPQRAVLVIWKWPQETLVDETERLANL